MVEYVAERATSRILLAHPARGSLLTSRATPSALTIVPHKGRGIAQSSRALFF